MTRQIIFFLTVVSASAQQLKLNEIQIVGTHNSYHAGISPHEMDYLRKVNPQAAEALDYRHPSLTTQLNDGARQVEIDVYGDAKGGLFAHPAGPGLAAKAGLPADPDFDPNHFAQSPDTAWRNRAVADSYEPGSTFKLITAAASLRAR